MVHRIAKKNHKSLGIGGLVPEHYCLGAWKQQDMNPKSIWQKSWFMSLKNYDNLGKKGQPLKLYVVTMLIFQIKTI